MRSASYPVNETERIAALQSYSVLDTACEASFDNLAELAAMITQSPISAVSLVDSSRQWFKACFGCDVVETPRDVSFCAHAILDPSAPLIVADALTDDRFANNPLVTGPMGIRFYAGMPLINPDGAALGTLCVIDRQPRVLTEREILGLRRLADAVMTTLELRRALALLHHHALSDSLTGLPNRAALFAAAHSMMALQRRDGGPFCLLLIDLDGFKEVNDRLGHAAGDAVLVAVANELRATMRSEDFAARLGGDEFAVLAPCGPDGGAALAARFNEHLARAMEALSWPVTASIGIACLEDPPASLEAALQQADAALYAIKEKVHEARRARHGRSRSGIASLVRARLR